jgi:NADH:ubiquinone oxidoreductase subunit K
MTSKSRIKSLDEIIRLIGEYAGVIAGAGFPYFIAFFGVKWALPTRPVVALVVSIITLLIAIWLAVALSRFIKHSMPTTIAIVGLFVASAYASIGAFAGLSATIHTWRPTSYNVTASQPLLPTAGRTNDTIPVEDPFGIFAQYYTVVVLDLVPGIEVSKTMALPTTVEIKSRLGGLPVLGFKIYMIFAVIGAFKKWKEIRKEKTKGKAAS